MKIRITKPVLMFPEIEIGEIYEANEDRDGDFIFNIGEKEILVYPEECEVVEDSENVVTSIDRNDDGKLVATVEEPVREELYQITFVGKDSELNFVGVGSPRVEGLDVYIMSPDNKQAVVDKSKFLYFVIEPYNK